jgi:hypothetical protein
MSLNSRVSCTMLSVSPVANTHSTVRMRAHHSSSMFGT